MRYPVFAIAVVCSLLASCARAQTDPPEVFQLAGGFCVVDTCETTISYEFVGQTRHEPDLSKELDLADILSDDAQFDVRGRFRFSLRNHGMGGSQISVPADRFTLEFERGEFAHRWQWIGDSDGDPNCTSETSASPFDPDRVTGKEIVEAADRSECAQFAFAHVGISFIDTSDTNAVNLTLSSDLPPSNARAEYPFLEDVRQSSYGPFVVFGDSEISVATDASGWVAWVKAWDNGFQWKIAFVF